MKRIEDLWFTNSMVWVRDLIESKGYVLEGWDEFDYEKTLSHFRKRHFVDPDRCFVFYYKDAEGRIYKPYNTLYYRGGKIKACMIFRRAVK